MLAIEEQRGAKEAGLDTAVLSDEFTPDEQRVKAVLDSELGLYQSIARETGFKIEFGRKTCFAHERDPPSVVIGVEQLAKLGLTSRDKLRYAVFHELGHLFELRQDPEGYLKMIEEAEARGPLAGVYFRLDNALADVYVNHHTQNRAPVYREGDAHSPLVKEIYRAGLFPIRDFTENPLCVQFCDYLLNLGMECGDDVKLSPEVRAEIEKGLRDFGGVEFSYEEYLKTFFTPVVGRAREDDGWGATVSERQLLIRRVIRPVFERLLKKDQEAGRDLSKYQEVGFGGLDFDPEDLKKLAKEAAAMNAEANLSPDEKAKLRIHQQLSDLCGKKGLSEEQKQDFLETYEKAQPLIQKFAALWERIRSKEISYALVERGHYTDGITLDVGKAIDLFPQVDETPDEAEVMLRRQLEAEQIARSRTIRVRLVLDVSTSMSSDLPEIKLLMVALCASMAIATQQTAGTDREVKGELQVYTFGTTEQEIMKLNNSVALDDVIEAFGKIKLEGSTNDHLALEKIDPGISAEDSRRISAGELVDVLLELTDGDTSDPEKSKGLVDSIEAKGVRTHAIKFKRAQVLLDDGKRFERIWNSERKRGHTLDNAEQAVEKVYELLEDVVGD